MRFHPYRTPARSIEPIAPDANGSQERALFAAQTFLLGWSLLRVAACTVRGLDLEGCVAVVLVVIVALALVAPSRVESSS